MLLHPLSSTVRQFMPMLKIILQCLGIWLLTSFTRLNLDTLATISNQPQTPIPKGLLYPFIYKISPLLWGSGRILEYFQNIEGLPLAVNILCFLLYLLMWLGTIAFFSVYIALLAPKVEASHEKAQHTLFLNTLFFHLAMIALYGLKLIEYGIILIRYILQ